MDTKGKEEKHMKTMKALPMIVPVACSLANVASTPWVPLVCTSTANDTIPSLRSQTLRAMGGSNVGGENRISLVVPKPANSQILCKLQLAPTAFGNSNHYG
jgi:hypothetical protein